VGAGVGIRRLLRLRAAFKASSAIGVLAALILPQPAAAQSIWGGSGSTSATTDYNTATNWSNPPGVAPTSPGTSAVFANTGQGTVNVSAAVSPNSWTFATNAQSYAITGANVTFSTCTGLISNANAGQTISIDNSLGGAGGIALNGNSTLTLTAINTYTGATPGGSTSWSQCCSRSSRSCCRYRPKSTGRPPAAARSRPKEDQSRCPL